VIVLADQFMTGFSGAGVPRDRALIIHAATPSNPAIAIAIIAIIGTGGRQSRPVSKFRRDRMFFAARHIALLRSNAPQQQADI
jgi:hypothetical protein